MNNRKWNARNPHQGNYKKVLCVCSAGLLRSPIAAKVLANDPYNFNTRACGLEKDFALIPIDDVLLEWADEVVVMTHDQMNKVRSMGYRDKIVVLGIDDNYSYNDPELVHLINQKYLSESHNSVSVFNI